MSTRQIFAHFLINFIACEITVVAVCALFDPRSILFNDPHFLYAAPFPVICILFIPFIVIFSPLNGIMALVDLFSFKLFSFDSLAISLFVGELSHIIVSQLTLLIPLLLFLITRALQRSGSQNRLILFHAVWFIYTVAPSLLMCAFAISGKSYFL